MCRALRNSVQPIDTLNRDHMSLVFWGEPTASVIYFAYLSYLACKIAFMGTRLASIEADQPSCILSCFCEAPLIPKPMCQYNSNHGVWLFPIIPAIEVIFKIICAKPSGTIASELVLSKHCTALHCTAQAEFSVQSATLS